MSWPYSKNIFKSQHNSAFVKFVKIIHYTLSSLKASKGDDPKYLAMYNLLLPISTQYDVLFALWLAASGPSESSVEAFNDILKEESANIHLWDLGVQAVYIDTTIEWKTIFPNKMSGFYAPSTEVGKILEVQACAERMDAFPLVLTTKTKVQLYHDKMNTAYELKDLNQKVFGKASDDLKTYQEFAAEELWGILGELMTFHRYEPLKTDAFFDLEDMRIRPTPENITLKVNEYQYYVGPRQMINLPLSYNKRSILKGRVYLGGPFKVFSDNEITSSVIKIPTSTRTYSKEKIVEHEIGELGALNNPYIMLYNDSDEDGMLVITVKK